MISESRDILCKLLAVPSNMRLKETLGTIMMRYDHFFAKADSPPLFEIPANGRDIFNTSYRENISNGKARVLI